MGFEIEMKFTVNDKIINIINRYNGVIIRQGYLNSIPERTVRVRTKGEKAFLTIKGKNEGLKRAEFEYEIPTKDALELLKLCEPNIIVKTRYTFIENGLKWELDVFDGIHKGLIIAELELENENIQIDLPKWIEKNVSEDSRYYNSNLAKSPWNGH